MNKRTGKFWEQISKEHRLTPRGETFKLLMGKDIRLAEEIMNTVNILEEDNKVGVLFHNGKSWSIKLFDKFIKDSNLDEKQILVIVISMSIINVNTVFTKRIQKKYFYNFIEKYTPKYNIHKPLGKEGSTSLEKHFDHLKETTNFTNDEIYAFISEHLHPLLTKEVISARLKFYRSGK